MKALLLSVCLSAALGACAGGGSYIDPFSNLRDQSFSVVAIYANSVRSFLSTGTPEQAIENSKQAVASSLKDPGSAQFRNVRIVSHTDGKVVCGEVNGKNSYGGYVGFVPFVASTETSTLYHRDTKYPEIQAAANAGLTAACS